MSEHITNLGILAARADGLAAQLEQQGQRSLAAARRALAERYRQAIAEAVHEVKEREESDASEAA